MEIKYIKETEKAVSLYLVIETREFAIENDNLSPHVWESQSFHHKLVWIPKSQLVDGVPSKWISRKKAEEFVDELGGTPDDILSVYFSEGGKKSPAIWPAESEKDKEWKAKREADAKARLDRHIAKTEAAKALGVKGIRKGLTRAVLDAKIREAGYDPSTIVEESKKSVLTA